MKLTAALLSLCVLAFAAPLAHADTLYFSLTDGTTNIVFDLQTAPGTLTATASTSHPTPGFADFLNVPFTLNGQQELASQISFWNPKNSSNQTIEIFEGFSSLVFYQTGTGYYNGSSVSPTFVLGNFALSGGYTLNISTVPPAPAATAVTPEPSSLLLLGTGVLGMVGVVRRRVQAMG